MRTRTVRFNLDGLDFAVEVYAGSRPTLYDPGDPPSTEVTEAAFQGKPIRADHLERYIDGKHSRRFDEKIVEYLLEEE